MPTEFQESNTLNPRPYINEWALDEERQVDPGLSKITYVLDQMFKVPGTKWSFGLDPIIGFVFPGVGDTVSALIGVYVLLRSIQYGLPKVVIGRMVFNIALDYLVGSIPIVGDMFDFAFKSNRMNIALLNRFAAGKGKAKWTDWLWVFILLGAFAAVIFLIIFSVWWFIRAEHFQLI